MRETRGLRARRVAIVHAAYAQRGGEDAVVQEEAELLRQHGCDVLELQCYNSRLRGAAKVRAVGVHLGIVDAAREVRAALHDFGADIVHVHNVFPSWGLAPYFAARELGLPCVQTLHNYRLVCANALLFRDGQVCEDCVGTLPWRGVARGCYRGSVLASGVVAAGIVRQRQQVTHLVDVFIALTGFARERFIAGGLPAERIVVRPNFVRPATVRVGPRRGVLFVGRMSEEKGVTRLVQSWRGLPWPLTCVGDGPLLEALRRSPPRGVEFVGRKSGPEIAERLAAAQCLVVPSLVYEGFPLVIAEACRAGTPVVAPARGSLAEIVAGLGIGVLYDPVREGSLREALQQVLEPEALSRFSEAAFRAWTTKLSPEAAAESLEEIYAQAETTCRGRSTAGSRHRD